MALQNHRLTSRLLLLTEKRPDLLPNIARYLRRYKKLPRAVAEELIRRVNKGSLYDHVTAQYVNVLTGRVTDSQRKALLHTLKREWKPSSPSIDLKAAIGGKLVINGRLSTAQVQYAVERIREWWVRCELLTNCHPDAYSTTVLKAGLNKGLRDKVGDVSIAAAYTLALWNIDVERPLADINPAGGKVLRQFGVVRRAPGVACGIDWIFQHICEWRGGLSWRHVFGTDYVQAERQAVLMRAMALTNATAFVNGADVFNDLLLNRMFLHDPALGRYRLGKIGHYVKNARLLATFPHHAVVCREVNNARHESNLSHPIVRNTGRPTGRIPFKFIRTARNLYRAALSELEDLWD